KKPSSRTCNKCGVKFALFYQYVSHMRIHTGVTPYKCNGCGVYFSQTGSLARHKTVPGRCKQIFFESGIEPGLLQRECCGPPVQNKSQEVKEDVVIAQDKPPVQKDLIPAKLPEKLPECYVQLTDISNTHCCKFCGESFLTAKKARKHICHLHKSESTPALHEDQNGSQSQMVPKGKFKCPICPRHFKYSYNRARHLRICVRQCIEGQKDRDDGKYQCPLCSSLFSFASNRHRHINTVCIKDYVARASKGLTTLRTEEVDAKHKEPSQSQDNEQPTQSRERHRRKRVRKVPPGIVKCHLCPAVFRYCSGLYRHLKKHELFKLTGKLFRYRNSASSVTSEQSALPSAETDHNKDPKVIHQRKLQCTVCKMALSSVKELIQHRKTHSKKGKLQCPDCNQEFPYPVYLRRHLESHRKKENKLSQIQAPTKMKPQHLPDKSPPEQEKQDEEQLQCSLCKEVYVDLAEIRKHFLTHVSGLSCPFCQQNFTDRRYLVRHMVRHTGYTPYSCAHCGKHFYREIYYRLHSVRCVSAPIITKVKSQKRTTYPCSYCPRVFTKKDHQKNHHRGHEANTLHLCTKCDQFFGNNKYKSHMKKCMNIKPNPESSPSQSDLDKGSPESSQQPLNKPVPNSATKVILQCEHCDQTFRFKSLLMRHLVSHTGLQPYVCVRCGERFKSQSICAQHESSCQHVSKVEESKTEPESEKQSVNVPKAEGDKKYNCRFCTRTFMKARNLRRHILTHNEVNPYRCKACNSCFSRYDHLKVHQTHCKRDRTRLEVCIPKISLDDVGKGWQTKYSFETSKKQDMFDCQFCSKSFSTQSVLARHNSVFHLAGSFKCAGCGSSFMHQSSLRKHIKKKRTCAKLLKTEPMPNTDSELTNTVKKPLSVVKNRILHRIQPQFVKKSKYFCSFCPRVFTNNDQLCSHTYLHTGERPYSCDFCGDKFIRRDILQRHFLKCTKKKQQNKVPCDTCDGFFPSNKLETHKVGCISKATPSPRVSPQPSPGSPLKGFSCANCSSRFLLFSQLQEHYLTAHKGETAHPVVAAPLQHHLSMMKIKEEPLEDSYNLPPIDAPGVGAKLDKEKDLDPLACPECNMTFINKAGLSGHLRVHKDVPFHCSTCNRGFWNKHLLSLHQKKCRSEDNSEDDTAWQMEGPLKAHIDFALNDPTPHFNEDSESSGSWQNCLGSEEKKPESSTGSEKKAVQYQCSECEKTFTDGLMLISHLEEHGREEQEKKRKTCSKCRRVFASLNDLEKHMKIHGEKEISCPKCPYRFGTLSELEEHRVFHDQNRSFSCKVCHLRFRTKISLCEHFAKDHPEDAFHCRYCDKAYSQKKSLYRHYSQYHQSERMALKATVLEKRSADKAPSSQASAADDESGNCGSDTEDSDSDSADYFPCHVCGKTFLTSESLEDHQLCHLGKKPHECAECGKCFYQASQLQQHQRMHKSEFQCRLCGRGFVSLFALRKHKHNHGKKRPHRCSKCHLSFKGPLHLAEHMATHREESFPCDICNCVFTSKSSRAEHRKSHSKSVPGPPCTCACHDAGFSGNVFTLQDILLPGMFRHLHWTGLLAGASGVSRQRGAKTAAPAKPGAGLQEPSLTSAGPPSQQPPAATHLPDSPSSSLFICDCGEEFHDFNLMLEHKRSHVSGGELTQRVCENTPAFGTHSEISPAACQAPESLPRLPSGPSAVELPAGAGDEPEDGIAMETTAQEQPQEPTENQLENTAAASEEPPESAADEDRSGPSGGKRRSLPSKNYVMKLVASAYMKRFASTPYDVPNDDDDDGVEKSLAPDEVSPETKPEAAPPVNDLSIAQLRRLLSKPGIKTKSPSISKVLESSRKKVVSLTKILSPVVVLETRQKLKDPSGNCTYGSYQCGRCRRVFENLDRLTEHHFLHKKERIKCCRRCKQLIIGRMPLPDKHICPQLGRRPFQLSSSFRNKMQCSQKLVPLHSLSNTRKVFFCPVCKHSYARRWNLKNHKCQGVGASVTHHLSSSVQNMPGGKPLSSEKNEADGTTNSQMSKSVGVGPELTSGVKLETAPHADQSSPPLSLSHRFSPFHSKSHPIEKQEDVPLDDVLALTGEESSSWDASLVDDEDGKEGRWTMPLDDETEMHSALARKANGIDPRQGGDDAASPRLSYFIKEGVKRYPCNGCQKTYSRASTLNRHLRLCGFWPRGVAAASGAQAAPLSNSKPKPLFPCYVCGRSFNRKDNMMTHRARCQLKHSVANVDAAAAQPRTSGQSCGRAGPGKRWQQLGHHVTALRASTEGHVRVRSGVHLPEAPPGAPAEARAGVVHVPHCGETVGSWADYEVHLHIHMHPHHQLLKAYSRRDPTPC
ncbi:unnamed protein product, partial [Tetraodon nigroviridis]